MRVPANLKFAALAGTLILLALPAAPASAVNATAAIPVGDLDLTAEDGRQALLKRARKAAVRACAPLPYPVAYDAELLRECKQRFIEAAERRLAEAAGPAPTQAAAGPSLRD